MMGTRVFSTNDIKHVAVSGAAEVEFVPGKSSKVTVEYKGKEPQSLADAGISVNNSSMVISGAVGGETSIQVGGNTIALGGGYANSNVHIQAGSGSISIGSGGIRINGKNIMFEDKAGQEVEDGFCHVVKYVVEYVYAPESVTSSGASRIRGKFNSGDKDMSFKLSGVSSVKVSGQVREADLQTSGSTELTWAEGTVEKVRVKASGASGIDLSGATVASVTSVSTSGASRLNM